MKVVNYIRVIKEKWPTIECNAPLPQSGDTGYNKMIGFGAPFSPAKIDDAPAVDTTWALSWPKAYILLLGFLTKK